MWRYIMDNSGEMVESGEIELDDTWSVNDCFTFIRGCMFEASWSPDTPYIIQHRDSGDWKLLYASWNWRDED
jgi:hypothetical protein